MSKHTLEDILKKADELGIEYEINSDTPGFFITDEKGNERKVSLEEIMGL